MVNLKRASRQLFSRPADECFNSLPHLMGRCYDLKEYSDQVWSMPTEITPVSRGQSLSLEVRGNEPCSLNDWSFSQLCSLAGVQKDTVNRLTPETAARVLSETLPSRGKPLQLLTTANGLRSIHGASYTRLFDIDLLNMVKDVAGDFGPPPKGFNGATGLYAGEQDMFAFLIDDSAWVDIGGQQFAPGFFVWNSEVGRRTIGIETFWFQHICGNHIVWDAIEVVGYARKHTANVDEALDEIQSILCRLISVRNQRRDQFAKTIENAMHTKIGSDADEVTQQLTSRGFTRGIVKNAIEMIVQQSSQFTIFGVVDAMTRLSGKIEFAGERAEMDSRIGSLLSLAT